MCLRVNMSSKMAQQMKTLFPDIFAYEGIFMVMVLLSTESLWDKRQN